MSKTDLQSTATPTPAAPAKSITPNLRPRKKKKTKWIVFAVIILVVGLLIGRNILFPQERRSTVNYSVETVSRRHLTVTLDGTGTLEPKAAQTLMFPLAGDILDAPFKEGDQVKKDDVLFNLDPESLDISLERAQLAVSQAENNYNQLMKSHKDLRVESTASGVIQTLFIEENGLISAGMQVASILDNSAMLLECWFFSSDIAGVTVGSPALLTFDGTFETVSGVVDTVSPTTQVGEGGAVLQQVKIKVQNPGGISESSYATATVGGVSCAKGGNFSALTQKTITSTVSGSIAALHVKEGDRVTEGQLLATLDSDNIDNQTRLSQLALQDARLALQSAQDQLDNFILKAPLSGTLIRMDKGAGEVADAGTVAAIIYDMSCLTFDMNVDELDVSALAIGQEVEVTTDALAGRTFTGRVSRIGLDANTQTGTTTYPVTVTVEEYGALLPGMNVNAVVIISENEDVLSIPVDAVSRGNTVLVSAASPNAAGGTGGEVEGYVRVPVELGINNEDYIEITGGLSEGDEIAIVIQRASSIFDSMPMGGMMQTTVVEE